MMEIEINGSRRTLDPTSIDELRGYLSGALPTDEVICVLRVNGENVAEEDLRSYDVASIRNVEVQSARPETLARDAIPETIDWILRLCGMLRSLGEDYRCGRERQAAERLVSVADALQVLVGLLSGIREFAALNAATQGLVDGPWDTAERDLQLALDAFVSEFENGDSVRLADLLSHELPRILESFNFVLEKMST
jgi:hypothetical protein